MKLTNRVSLETFIDFTDLSLPLGFSVFRLGALTTIISFSFLCFTLDVKIRPK